MPPRPSGQKIDAYMPNFEFGTAGVASAFLHLVLAEQGRYRAILFPNTPFPERIPA